MIRPGGTNESNGTLIRDPDYLIDVVTASENFPGEVGGFVGATESHVTAEGTPGVFDTPSAYFWRGEGTEETWIDQEQGGFPGRVNRLAYDAKGPAYSGSTANFLIDGRRISPDNPSIRQGGPVGNWDIGNYNAIALAQSTADFPEESIAQLRVLLAI